MERLPLGLANGYAMINERILISMDVTPGRNHNLNTCTFSYIVLCLLIMVLLPYIISVQYL